MVQCLDSATDFITGSDAALMTYSWQEALVFNGVSMIQACLNVDVMQTEHVRSCASLLWVLLTILTLLWLLDCR